MNVILSPFAITWLSVIMREHVDLNERNALAVSTRNAGLELLALTNAMAGTNPGTKSVAVEFRRADVLVAAISQWLGISLRADLLQMFIQVLNTIGSSIDLYKTPLTYIYDGSPALPPGLDRGFGTDVCYISGYVRDAILHLEPVAAEPAVNHAPHIAGHGVHGLVVPGPWMYQEIRQTPVEFHIGDTPYYRVGLSQDDMDSLAEMGIRAFDETVNTCPTGSSPWDGIFQYNAFAAMVLVVLAVERHTTAYIYDYAGCHFF